METKVNHKMSINFENGIYSFTDKSGKIRKSKSEQNIHYYFKREFGSSATPVATQEVAETKNQFSINERFEFIENYVSMVAEKIQPSLILTGSGGLGKTFTVNKSLKFEGYVDVSNTESFIEGERLPAKHYKVVKGFSTPKALYRLLYENKDSILVFDDCDSVLRDPVAANLLKGALDSSDERIISWNSEMRFGSEDDLPRSFRFTGGVIFISNLNKDKIPQALLTRSVCVDVSMKLNEKIERMQHIMAADEFMPEADMSLKLMALDIIDRFKHQAREVSMRTLIQTVKIAQKFSGEKFEKMAQYSLCN